MFSLSFKNGIIVHEVGDIMSTIKEKDVIKVTITGIQKYGAFAMLPNHYNGLIHISEISYGYVADYKQKPCQFYIPCKKGFFHVKIGIFQKPTIFTK